MVEDYRNLWNSRRLDHFQLYLEPGKIYKGPQVYTSNIPPNLEDSNSVWWTCYTTRYL